MTRKHAEQAVKEMSERGGSFAKNLASLWRIADSDNKSRIETTWADMFDRYAQNTRRYVAHIHSDDGGTTVVTDLTPEEVRDPSKLLTNRSWDVEPEVEHIEIVEVGNTVASWSNPNCSSEQPFR